jgi:hypothetical protein
MMILKYTSSNNGEKTLYGITQLKDQAEFLFVFQFFLGITGKKGKKNQRGEGKFHLDNVPLEIFCCCLMSLGSFNAWFKKVC